MNKSRLELSFDRDKTVNTTARVRNGNASFKVKLSRLSRERDLGRDMSSLESAPPHLLMQNVRDIRKRLLETEKTLGTITKAEAKLELEDDLDDLISVTSSEFRKGVDSRGADFHDNADDDRESIHSGLATLPDSSYAGFERVQPPSSTPNRNAVKSRLTGLLEMVEPRDDVESVSDRKHSDVDDDRQDLRAQIRFLKEANKKVLIQNQKLMNEVEKTSYELQSSRAKIRELSYELDEFRQSVPDLEDKVLGLQAETETQDKALREAEERYETCQREVVQGDRKYREYQAEIDELRAELYEERKLRRGLESQRDEALQNFIEVQDSLGEFQKKTKDRQKKSETNEDHLRDSLSLANREREELIERLSWFQSKVKGQQEEIRRLQSLQEVEEETKADIEEQNNLLRSQISKLSSRTTRLEADAELLDNVQFENKQLKDEVEMQQKQLSVCQQEIEESRTMLLQLEQLAHQVQHNYSHSAASRNNSFGNDSGNFSIRHGADSSMASFHKSAGATETSFARARPTSPSQGATTGAKTILSDLRLKLAMKDAEIQRLQASLQERAANDQSSTIENLRTDLTAMIEKNQKCAEQAQELNAVIKKVEGERDRVTMQNQELQRRFSEQDSLNSSVELRINQRNTQLVELQEQLNDRAMAVSKLERQVRQKTSQVTSLEERLEDQKAQCTHQAAQITQFQEEIAGRETEAQTLHKELREKRSGVSEVRDEADRVQRIHQEQCKDYQKQIDILQERVDNKASQANEWEKQTDILRREVSDKSHRLYETELLLTRTQEDLERKAQQSKEMLRQLEMQARDGTDQIKQLETALNMCKEEIQTYIGALEETKEMYNKELAQKEEKIKRLDRQFKICGHELEVKTQECEDYEKQVLEGQAMLQQGVGRIHELEEVQAKLHKQISNLEHELLSSNSQWLSDQQTMEVKLTQACEDLEKRTEQLRQLTDTLKTVQDQKNRLSSEVDLLEGQVEDDQEELDTKADRMARLEKDMRDMRVQLEQKIELVTDFEDQLQQKNLDMEQQLQLVSDLDIEIKRLQDTYQEALDKISELEKDLDKAGYEAKAKDEMMEDLKESLMCVQEELSSRKSEATNLKEMLDERQTELQDRVALVSQLDKTIKEQHQEMEQRIHRLDANVRKNEIEVQERTTQIADLDNKLQETQSQLREKTLQQQQTEQLAHKQQMELNSKTAKLQELESLVDRQKLKLEEQKEENVEITQELRLTREQLQQQHADFMSTRRELAQTNREQERLQRELEEIRVISESREGDSARLAEELGAAKARESETQSRIAAEVQKLSDEHEDLEKKYRVEINSLREEIGDYTEANNILKAQLKQKIKQTNDIEQHYAGQVQVAAQELDGINEEMETRKQQMDNANEQLILRDSEIARLQAKISGLERTLTSMRMAESFNVTPSSQEGNQGQSLPGTKDSSRNKHRREEPRNSREVILTDVSVHFPNKQGTSQGVKFDQEVEIQFVSKVDKNNSAPDKGSGGVPLKESSEGPDQENIEPSGPVRVLNFTECEEKNSYNSVLHRPKPVLPSGAFSKARDAGSSGGTTKDTASAAAKQQSQKHSAFSRVKDNKSERKEKSLPGEKELEPLTAMRIYNPDTFESNAEDLDPEQCMRELHERLRANERRQLDIDRQLESLEDEEHIQDSKR